MTSRQTYALLSLIVFLSAGFLFWWSGVSPVIGFALVVLGALIGAAGVSDAPPKNAH